MRVLSSKNIACKFSESVLCAFMLKVVVFVSKREFSYHIVTLGKICYLELIHSYLRDRLQMTAAEYNTVYLLLLSRSRRDDNIITY